MSDDILNTDTIPVPSPSEQALPPAPDTSEIINERRQIVLDQLSRSENIEDYAAERQVQEAVIDRGQDVTQEQQNQWFRRASAALKAAADEAAGITTNGQGEQPSEPPPGYIAGDEAMRQVDYARKEGAVRMRIDQHFGPGINERKQQIIDWHQSMDPESKVASWIVENESQFAPQILERLADNPEALQQIASMPANQRDRWLGALEGDIAAETNFAQKMAQQGQQWQQDRRMTKAPPPIRPPRGGGAMPPSDIHQLASRGESADDYVKARRAMEKKRD